MSSKNKDRLHAFGDMLTRAAKPEVEQHNPPPKADPPVKLPTTQPETKRKTLSLQTQTKPASARPAPPSSKPKPPKDRSHLTRLHDADHQRLLNQLIGALKLPEGAIDQVPKIFQSAQLRPLKIGIAHDLHERFSLESGKARKNLGYILGVGLSSKLPYQRAILEHDLRYDLDGNAAGEVSKEDKEYARKRIKGIWDKINTAKEKSQSDA